MLPVLITKRSFVSTEIYVPVIASPDLCVRWMTRIRNERSRDYHVGALRRIRAPESPTDFYSIDDIGAMKSL